MAGAGSFTDGKITKDAEGTVSLPRVTLHSGQLRVSQPQSTRRRVTLRKISYIVRNFITCHATVVYHKAVWGRYAAGWSAVQKAHESGGALVAGDEELLHQAL